MDIISFVPEQLFSLIIALYIMGVLFKSSNIIDDELIPFCLLSLSVLASVFLIGFTVEGIIQGVICTGVAIGINESNKQLKKIKEVK